VGQQEPECEQDRNEERNHGGQDEKRRAIAFLSISSTPSGSCAITASAHAEACALRPAELLSQGFEAERKPRLHRADWNLRGVIPSNQAGDVTAKGRLHAAERQLESVTIAASGPEDPLRFLS
jgi:hypothetical protein